MLKFKKAAFFQYPVSDIQRARHFYENVLGFELEFQNEEHQWFEYNLKGTTLAITNCVPGQIPGSPGAILALEVFDLDESIKDLAAKSVKLVVEPFVTDVCRMTIISDPDGNHLCLHQLKDE